MNQQIELVTCGHSTIVHFRDAVESISYCCGRMYTNPTLSSLQRIVKLMNDRRKISLEVKIEGKSVTILGWKRQEYDPWG